MMMVRVCSGWFPTAPGNASVRDAPALLKVLWVVVVVGVGEMVSVKIKQDCGGGQWLDALHTMRYGRSNSSSFRRAARVADSTRRGKKVMHWSLGLYR